MYRVFRVASQPSGLGNAGCVYAAPGKDYRLPDARERVQLTYWPGKDYKLSGDQDGSTKYMVARNLVPIT